MYFQRNEFCRHWCWRASQFIYWLQHFSILIFEHLCFLLANFNIIYVQHTILMMLFHKFSRSFRVKKFLWKNSVQFNLERKLVWVESTTVLGPNFFLPSFPGLRIFCALRVYSLPIVTKNCLTLPPPQMIALLQKKQLCYCHVRRHNTTPTNCASTIVGALYST